MRYAVAVVVGITALASACALVTSLADLGSTDASCSTCDGGGNDGGIEAGPGTDCKLAVSPTLLVVDAGSTSTVNVTLTRLGSFTGPVVVNLNGVAGVSANPITVGTGEDGGTLYVDVASTVPAEAADLEVLSSTVSCGSAIVTLAVRGVLDGGVFASSGTFAVPKTTYLTSLRFTMWGGGGGGNYGGSDGCSGGGSGGYGGYVRNDLTVTPGEPLAITIGGGGAVGGGGGGCTTVARASTNLLIAPGGGGGGRAGYVMTNFCPPPEANGGGGGGAGYRGSNGQSYQAAAGGGGGDVGGATAGGDGGVEGGSAGSSLSGGAGATNVGGSGGCGLFGGGGGGAGAHVSPNTGGAGGGGGGSPFAGDGGTFTKGGSWSMTDPLWDNNAGMGGSGGFGSNSTTAGVRGRVVVMIP